MSAKIYNCKYCLLLLFISIKGFSQFPFVHTWGGGTQHVFSQFIELKDSTFILAGSQVGNTSASSHVAGVLMRCNKDGDSLYTFVYDTSQFIGLALATDSEVMVTGGFFDMIKGIISVSKINFMSGDTSFCNYVGPLSSQASPGWLHKCNDNGYIMLNYDAASYGYIKLDSNANIQWHKYHTMAYSAWQIKPDLLGGYVAVGNRGWVADPYGVQRLDSAGNIIWNRGYGNIPVASWNQYYIAMDVAITDDTNYIVACYNNVITFMKINSITGDTIWTKLYPGKSAFHINNAGNDTYITVTDSFGLISGNGNFIWQTPIVPLGFVVNNCTKTLDGGYAFCGTSSNYQTMVFVKLDSLGNTVNTSIFDIEKHKQVYFYPNPASDVLNFAHSASGNFTFSVYDLFGNKVASVKNKTSIDVSALTVGVYVAEVSEGDKVMREKFVKE